MLFCFRLFYFRFKSFLRAELKSAFARVRFRSGGAAGVYGVFLPVVRRDGTRRCATGCLALVVLWLRGSRANLVRRGPAFGAATRGARCINLKLRVSCQHLALMRGNVLATVNGFLMA